MFLFLCSSSNLDVHAHVHCIYLDVHAHVHRIYACECVAHAQVLKEHTSVIIVSMDIARNVFSLKDLRLINFTYIHDLYFMSYEVESHPSPCISNPMYAITSHMKMFHTLSI